MHACVSEFRRVQKSRLRMGGVFAHVCREPPPLRCGPLSRQLNNSTTRHPNHSLLRSSQCPLPPFSKLSICDEGTAFCPPTPPMLTPSIVWKDHPVSASPRMGRILSQLQSPFPQSSISSATNHKTNPYLGSQEDN